MGNSNIKTFIEYVLNNKCEFPLSIHSLMKELNISNYSYIYRNLRALEKEKKLILIKKGKQLLIVK